jgi:hypothetical protein
MFNLSQQRIARQFKDPCPFTQSGDPESKCPELRDTTTTHNIIESDCTTLLESAHSLNRLFGYSKSVLSNDATKI